MNKIKIIRDAINGSICSECYEFELCDNCELKHILADVEDVLKGFKKLEEDPCDEKVIRKGIEAYNRLVEEEKINR